MVKVNKINSRKFYHFGKTGKTKIEDKKLLENITLDVLINHLGPPTKKVGGEYVWQCPYCQDTHKDNLKFNENKNFLKCFANDRHAADVLSDINKGGYINYPKNDFKPVKSLVHAENKLSDEQFDNNLIYMLKCQENLNNNEKALAHLYKKRGITQDTAEFCGIGIDKDLHYWTFPIFEYTAQSYAKVKIIGFEYRPAILPNAIKSKRTEQENKAKQGICRKKGSLSSLAAINAKTLFNDRLAIVEGFLDGYVLYQYLKEQKQDICYHIVTPSNGIGVLKNQINSVDFSKYTDVYLYADNDEKSKPIVDEIICKYPFIKVIQLDCCKDFNEHYCKCIKGTKTDD